MRERERERQRRAAACKRDLAALVRAWMQDYAEQRQCACMCV